jgi:cell division protein FtsN
MPAPKRTRYSDDYGGGSSAVRTLGAFLLCAVLSFALGFFVLARFWSSKPIAEGGSPTKNTVATAGERNVTRHNEEKPAPLRTALPAEQTKPRVVAPRIDPEEDVQKPSSPDEARDVKKPVAGADDNMPDPSADPKKSDESREIKQTADKAPADPPVATEETKPKRRKKTRTPDETQASKQPDAESVPPESTDDVNDVRAARRKRAERAERAGAENSGGLYRVQIGVYSTREKAEEQAKSASDKGFEATVHTMSNGDRTLYRVQHSAHRNRSRAETEKQRLVDAGIDAYINNP